MLNGHTHRHIQMDGRTDGQTHTHKKGVRDSGSAKARPGVKRTRHERSIGNSNETFNHLLVIGIGLWLCWGNLHEGLMLFPS